MQEFVKIEDSALLTSLIGPYDSNLKILEKELGIEIFLEKEGLSLRGSPKSVKKAKTILEGLLSSKIPFTPEAISSYSRGGNFRNREEAIEVSSPKRFIYPKTKTQKEYVRAIRNYDLVFSIGPAGTGKTYLACALAVNYLSKGKVGRIILTRPAIEAGESLGFLPGDMYEKLDPYLRPLYDALYDMMDAQTIEDHLETGVIEVAPLAYMRGRTLNNAFIILDEAQNCTLEQLKMFLTRLGFDSKTVITGDITQSDLPGGKPSGLLTSIKLLEKIEQIKFIYLTDKDVVRCELVQRIIKAYEKIRKE
ncbi:MAG TPA: PhoH family protein [Candidatus Omnitrophica bacterium]|nr:MAG: PhoH family protein [Candidatus Omnitrophota bacterium]RKY34515.1 MAG: PhoH family protein [Candidatus Omnitrophota bacterium]RKY44864.1 MAG: PhoH family protein [Candidatus Omnitrophota bacterium]HEC69694.1 PhoH family protein [Candidatus Omnitrophota bacterium]